MAQLLETEEGSIFLPRIILTDSCVFYGVIQAPNWIENSPKMLFPNLYIPNT